MNTCQTGVKNCKVEHYPVKPGSDLNRLNLIYKQKLNLQQDFARKDDRTAGQEVLPLAVEASLCLDFLDTF